MAKTVRVLTVTVLLVVALGTGSACKRSDTGGEPAATSTGSGANQNDTPDKPAPIAGAYLTSSIVKPQGSTALDLCLQLRASDGRRYVDANVDKGSWTYIAPTGVPKAAYKVMVTRLTHQKLRYYCHAHVKIQVTAASGLALAGGSQSQTMTQIANQIHLVFVPPTGKPLAGVSPLRSMVLGETNPLFSVPQAVVSTPTGADSTLTSGPSGTTLGGAVAPSNPTDTALTPLSASVVTTNGVPTGTPFDDSGATFTQDLGTFPYSSLVPTAPDVSDAEDPALAPATGTNTAPSTPMACQDTNNLLFTPTQADLDSIKLPPFALPEGSSPDQGVAGDGIPDSQRKCAKPSPEMVAIYGEITNTSTAPASEYLGCAWPCQVPDAAIPQADPSSTPAP